MKEIHDYLAEFGMIDQLAGDDENALRMLMSSILESIPHAVMGLKNRRIVFANHGVASVFGWAPEEIVGKDTRILYRSDEEYREIARRFYATLEKQRTHVEEFPARHKDGHDIMCLISTSRIGEQLKERMIVATYVDVSALKEADEAVRKARDDMESRVRERTWELQNANEELHREIAERMRVTDSLKESQRRMNDIIEFLPDATFAIDLDGRVIAWNRAIEEMTGVQASDMVGKGDYEYALPFYGTRRPILIDLVFRPHDEIEKNYTFIKRDGDILLTETDVPFVKGKSHTLWGKASPLYDSRRKVVGAIESIRDVTDKKKMEAQLAHAQKMEAIGTLAGGVAHDFNNLLMAILGYSSLVLLDYEPGHPHYDKLENIEKLVKSGADLTRQLLGFARGGKYEVKPTNINHLIDQQSELFGRTRKEISIYKKYEEDIRIIEVDRGQIGQVLLNLFVNAWQAMPGGGDLYLSTENIVLDEPYAARCDLSPGDYVRFSVTDTGVGMDGKTLERIFDPFFTTREMGRGTGLGLASAYGIIKNHGGTINVYSEKGQGSTFRIYLPASKKTMPKGTLTIVQPIRGNETILVVDDERDNLAVIRETLESLGYRVMAAGSGHDAVDIYKKSGRDIDLIILDMVMPGMGGGEAFDLLKSMDPGIKVILASGYSINGQAKDIMDRGCRAFIQKPFGIRDISNKIREVLDA